MSKPRKRKKKSATSGTYYELPRTARRTLSGFLVGAVTAFQVASCSLGSDISRPPSAARVDQAAPAGAIGFAACPQHFPNTPPAIAWPGRQRQLCFDGYAVLYSGQSKTPIYAVERLDRRSVETAKGIAREDHFYPDARLPDADRAQLEDYRGSGYDRGHMAPAGDMPTASAKAQSFSLANMVPQHPVLNQKAWNQIEQATRKYAFRAAGPVYVFTGPKFAETPVWIGSGHVWVPTATWKLVYAPAEHRAWAYVMGNDAGPHTMRPDSYEAFKLQIGHSLLAGLDAEH